MHIQIRGAFRIWGLTNLVSGPAPSWEEDAEGRASLWVWVKEEPALDSAQEGKLSLTLWGALAGSKI